MDSLHRRWEVRPQLTRAVSSGVAQFLKDGEAIKGGNTISKRSFTYAKAHDGLNRLHQGQRKLLETIGETLPSGLGRGSG